jgi:hypothetical protein
MNWAARRAAAEGGRHHHDEIGRVAQHRADFDRVRPALDGHHGLRRVRLRHLERAGGPDRRRRATDRDHRHREPNERLAHVLQTRSGISPWLVGPGRVVAVTAFAMIVIFVGGSIMISAIDAALRPALPRQPPAVNRRAGG